MEQKICSALICLWAAASKVKQSVSQRVTQATGQLVRRVPAFRFAHLSVNPWDLRGISEKEHKVERRISEETSNKSGLKKSLQIEESSPE